MLYNPRRKVLLIILAAFLPGMIGGAALTSLLKPRGQIETPGAKDSGEMAAAGEKSGSQSADDGAGAKREAENKPQLLKLDPEAVETAGIQEEPVRLVTMGENLSVPGSVEAAPGRSARVTPPASGKVVRVLANPGDAVREGQPVAVLDSFEVAQAQAAVRQAESSVQQAMAGLQVARAEVEQARAGVGQAGAVLEQAHTREGSARAALQRQQAMAKAGAFSQAPLQAAQQEFSTAQSDLLSSQREAAAQDVVLARMERLFKAELVSKSELEEARLRREQANIRLSRAASGLEIARAAFDREKQISRAGLLNAREVQTAEAEVRAVQGDVQKAMQDLNRSREDLGRAERGEQAARTAVSGARANLAASRANLGALEGGGHTGGAAGLITLFAPFGGTVTRRQASMGETVERSTPLFIIENLNIVLVQANVPEQDVARIRVGQPAEITVTSYPGERFGGRVQSIASEIDEKTRTLAVRCAVENRRGRLRPGMFARVTLATGMLRTALAVPASALEDAGAQRFVYVAEGGGYVRRPVQTGHATGNRVEILHGIRAGERIVTHGIFVLKSERLKDTLKGGDSAILEKILHFSFTQRFLVIAGSLLLMGIGIVSWQSLTLDAVPDITPNQVVINTRTPGMGPAEVERLVTFPVETATGGIPGVEEVRSLSWYGLSQVTVTFHDDIDTYLARQLVTERLGGVREQLPAGVPSPELGPVTTGLGEIYHYAVESDTRSPMDLRTLQDRVIRPQLRTVPGVAEVNSMGGYEKQYQVEVDPQKMLSRGISLRQVIEAVEKNNSNAGGGVIEREGEQTVVRSIGLATSEEDIANIVIAAERGIPVFVKDVAVIRESSPPRTGVSSKDGKEAVLGTALMLKGANGRTVATAVDTRLKAIRQQLPPDVKVTPVYNRSDLVNNTVGTVQKNLLEGGLLVIVILLMLLGNVRAALIVALAIPLSMLFAIIGMSHFGISGNLMSLGAIDFGLIVDGAVVMVENAVRRLAQRREQQGRTLCREEVTQVVREAAREVAQPVTFSVSIITVVYLPILALEGIEGKMFRPMAYTVVFALIGALLLTLTLIPALCSLGLSGDTRERRNPVMNLFGRVYRAALRFTLKSRGIVTAGALALLALSGWLFTRLGAEFIPQLDEGSILIQPVRLRTVSAGETVKLVTAMERALKPIPEVITVFSRSGTAEVATDTMPLSLTDGFIMLRPREQWRAGLTKQKLMDEMEERVKAVPGQGYGFTQPIQMRFSEMVAGVKADIGVKVFGEDLDVLREKAGEVAAVIRKLPGAEDVSVEQVDNIPVLEIRIDRQAIARVGVNVSDIQDWVQIAMGGQPVGQIVQGDRRFDLTIGIPEPVRSSIQALETLPIATPRGGAVPLSSLAALRMVPAPAQISHEHGKRRVVVQLNVRGVDLGTFISLARTAVEQKVKLDEGYYLEWGGQFENLQRARTRLSVVVPIALCLIFVLLFTTFGSLRQAALIYTGVPLAVTGGVIALALRGLPFSITAGVGFIALFGVAVLNGVVMVSAINRLREEGRPVEEAVQEGAMQRLRPVLMTALVAALGFIPMALNTGVGAEVQRPLATVVIGGIMSSTVLTLLVLPVLYVWFERDSNADC